MRLLIQRVSRAEVRVGGEVVGAIGPGLAVLVGVGRADSEADVQALAEKTVNLRIFRDLDGRTNRSLIDVAGSCSRSASSRSLPMRARGADRRSWTLPRLRQGDELYRLLCSAIEARGVRVARGGFGAEMELELVNDGPMTIWLDSAAT